MVISVHLFKDEEVKIIKKYRDKQKDGRLKIRFIAILMLAENIAIEIIASLVGKTVKTIENWYNMYIQGYPFKPGQGKRLVDFPMRSHEEVGWAAAHHLREHFWRPGNLFCPGLNWRPRTHFLAPSSELETQQAWAFRDNWPGPKNGQRIELKNGVFRHPKIVPKLSL